MDFHSTSPNLKDIFSALPRNVWEKVYPDRRTISLDLVRDGLLRVTLGPRPYNYFPYGPLETSECYSKTNIRVTTIVTVTC